MAGTLWSSIYDSVYFAATKWLTIDKGLNRIAEAFHPIVDSRLTLGRRIERISVEKGTNKTGIHWHQDGKMHTKSYDKTLVAVPFSVVKLWRRPALNPIMNEAITGLGYASACKVAVSLFRLSQPPGCVWRQTLT
jgi:monoamine oxidase